MSSTVLAINGNYHRNGIIGQPVKVILDELSNNDFQTEHIHLADCNNEFCSNCR